MTNHDRPTIVTLCGSTKFRKEFEAAQAAETFEGRLVISVGLFGHADGLELRRVVKAELDVLHMAKIDLADEILVINPGGYVGESTEREIAYAQMRGKRVRFWHSRIEKETIDGSTREGTRGGDESDIPTPPRSDLSP